MVMVAAKCTQCGAIIKVDNSQEVGVCSHCGMSFITENVVNNYTINNQTTIITDRVELHSDIKSEKLAALRKRISVVKENGANVEANALMLGAVTKGPRKSSNVNKKA